MCDLCADPLTVHKTLASLSPPYGPREPRAMAPALLGFWVTLGQPLPFLGLSFLV